MKEEVSYDRILEVYSNPSRAKMIFKSYDQAKEGVVREFLAGKYPGNRTIMKEEFT